MLFPDLDARDTKRDAFRHAYWSALNAYEYGESLAWQFGNAHEEEDNQEEFDRTTIMDMQ